MGALRASLAVRTLRYLKVLKDDTQFSYIPSFKQGSLAFFKMFGAVTKDKLSELQGAHNIMHALTGCFGDALMREFRTLVDDEEDAAQRALLEMYLPALECMYSSKVGYIVSCPGCAMCAQSTDPRPLR